MLLLSACDAGVGGGSPSPGAPGDVGATPGGVQDMGFARELVANGQVPPPEALVVEGMFSEHDLPLEGAACERLLCLRGALGSAPTLAGDASGWLQVGLSSNLNLETYTRPPLSLVFTVDVSGSMNWEYSTAYNEYQTPLKVAKAQMGKLVPNLNAEDEVAIVIYGSESRTVLDFTAGTEQEVILDAINALESEGSTNMEAGLITAYRLMQEAKAENSQRIMVFTDVQPNVGATTATEFETLVQEGASADVGLTVFGVGIGLGPDVMTAMSNVRGGNAFTLFGSRDVNRTLEEDWPWLANPIAYDLTLEVNPDDAFEVAEGYGFPTADKEAKLQTSTVFLSKRKGALLVRLEPTDEMTDLAVSGSLSYETLEGEEVTDTLQAALNDSDDFTFAQPSVGKTVALALLVANVKDAAELYATEQASAVTLMRAATERFKADIERLGADAGTLQDEVEFAEALLALMEEGAEQGTLYGQ